MAEIRAFVGHSFTEGDAEIVGRFLKFLDQLAKLNPNFSWQHAEPAEPKFLADKVMRLLADKNLFIGICTKKEQVAIQKKDTLTGFFNLFRQRNQDYVWKTSDWIIQEIGLAKGRGLGLILLIEDDVREPGGLQGDLEYIAFSRSAPEKCFGKIVEMVTALAPTAPSTAGVEAESRSEPPDENSSTKPPANNEWVTPQSTWKRRDFEFALMHMIAMDDRDGAKRINDEYLLTESGSDPQNKIRWEAYSELNRIVFSKNGSLDRLKKLSVENPTDSRIFSYLARAYNNYQQNTDAAIAYENAARHAKKALDALKCLREATLSYRRAGKTAEALAIVTRMKTVEVSASDKELEVLRTQQKLAEIEKDDDVLIGAMERLLDINPEDTDARFTLAYKHSELGNESLALLHYSRIPWMERSAATWNNLGAALDNLELPAKSVEAYQKAVEMKETLSMSNLANKFSGAGFLSEAQKLCDSAIAIENYHKNIGRTISRIKEIPEEENKREEAQLEKARPISEFYKEIGRALAKISPSNLSGRWQGPKCEFDVTRTGDQFSATGSYEQKSYGLMALAILGGDSRPGLVDSKPKRHELEYKGRIIGAAIFGNLVQKQDGQSPKASSSLLGSAGDDRKVFMVVDEENNTIRVVELLKKETPRFYELKRVEPGN